MLPPHGAWVVEAGSRYVSTMTAILILALSKRTLRVSACVRMVSCVRAYVPADVHMKLYACIRAGVYIVYTYIP